MLELSGHSSLADLLQRRCLQAEDFFASMASPVIPPVEPIVVIVGSSRGGTSLLFDLLRSTGAFRAITGEHTPLYKTYGVLPIEPGHEGDAAVMRDANNTGFIEALWRHSQPLPRKRSREVDISRISVLLERQWGGLGHPAELWHRVAAKIANGSEPNVSESEILLNLSSVPGLDVRYYDTTVQTTSNRRMVPKPAGPPVPGCPAVESPPFVVPSPADGLRYLQESATRPLLLKASVDAHRLAWMADQLGDIKVVHLVRNPAASVNGLMDGWLSHGFFSYLLQQPNQLSIEGYSATDWGRDWWKFDLPPDWQNHRSQRLPKVCAWQWASAHRSILASIDELGLSYCRVKAEDIMFGDSRTHTIREVMAFCGIEAHAPVEPRVVMSTALPAAHRWHARGAEISDAVLQPQILEVAERLGYGRSMRDAWI